MAENGPYRMGTIARLTGFSPVRLRAWERRFGLLEPGRGPGGQRNYTDDDLKVLERVRALLDEGRAIGEIAALGRRRLLGDAREKARTPEAGQEAPLLETVRTELVEAALALDSGRIDRGLDAMAAASSPEMVVEQVIEPVAHEIGRLWEMGACSVAAEHLITSVFRQRVVKLIEAAEPRTPRPVVIAACLPGEDHELGILMISYFVSRVGVRVLYLGCNLPLEACRHACSVTAPDAVLLSVTVPSVYRKQRAGLRALVEGAAPTMRFFVGGQGVPSARGRSDPERLRLIHPGRSAPETALAIAAEIRTRPGGPSS